MNTYYEIGAAETRVQILNEAGYTLQNANTYWKGIDLIILPLDMGLY